MKRSIARLFVPVLILSVLGCAAAATSAMAKPKATVSWTVPATANEGSPITFSWSAKRLGATYRLVVQRPFGTAHVWKSIMRLRAKTGTAQLPAQTLGPHRFRIAAFNGRRLLAQRTSTVSVFGAVPFTTLFNVNEEKALALPQNTFAYVGYHYDGDGPVTFQVKDNNCTHVHIAFAAREYYQHDSPGTETLTLVQESMDPVSFSAEFNTVSSLDADLIPGQSWAVNQSHVGKYGGNASIVYINGYAICNSTEPFSG
jgi:microcystin-dependent protein